MTDAHVALKARLLTELDEMEEDDAESREDLGPVEVDPQSVGRFGRTDALQDQAMVQDRLRRHDARRHLVEAALGRIEAGEYGLCAECGEPIPQPRLDLDPAAPTCIACASG